MEEKHDEVFDTYTATRTTVCRAILKKPYACYCDFVTSIVLAKGVCLALDDICDERYHLGAR